MTGIQNYHALVHSEKLKTRQEMELFRQIISGFGAIPEPIAHTGS
jgi:hypothetical protein